jgi:hypothetical protein
MVRSSEVVGLLLHRFNYGEEFRGSRHSVDMSSNWPCKIGGNVNVGSGIIIGWDSEIIRFKYQCLDVFKATWNSEFTSMVQCELEYFTMNIVINFNVGGRVGRNENVCEGS